MVLNHKFGFYVKFKLLRRVAYNVNLLLFSLTFLLKECYVISYTAECFGRLNFKLFYYFLIIYFICVHCTIVLFWKLFTANFHKADTESNKLLPEL